MDRNFDYVAFEEHFRGNRQSVREKLSIYLPLVRALTIDEEHPALDIGCGQGEWLRMLGENRIPAAGVDSDGGSVARCRQMGLNVEEGDLFGYLSRQQEGRYALVTAFHLVEHLLPEQQQELFRIVYDMLAPGGMVIIETPNPENTTVGSCNFYIDPTHTRPLPPPLLEYYASLAGFAGVRILRVNRSTTGVYLPPLSDDIPGAEHYNRLTALLLSRVFPAPDYALVAFRDHQPAGDIERLFDTITLANGDGRIDSASPGRPDEETGERELQIVMLENRLQEQQNLAAKREAELAKQNQRYSRLAERVDAVELLLTDRENDLETERRRYECLEERMGEVSILLREREAELAGLYNTELGKILRKYKLWKKQRKQARRAADAKNMPEEQYSTDPDTPGMSCSARQIFRQLSENSRLLRSE